MESVKGRVDQKALVFPELKMPYIIAESDDGKRYSCLLERLLEKKPIVAIDNFFDLGGESLCMQKILKAVQVFSCTR